MDNPLYDNIFYSKNDQLSNSFLDLNFTTISVETKPKLTTINFYPIEKKHNGLDKFSTVLLSKSEKIINKHNTIHRNLNHENYNQNENERQRIDKVCTNTSSLSFFRHLKNHFAQTLIEQLRNSVNEIYREDLKRFRTVNGFITVTAEEIRDRALLLKKCMYTTDISILQIYMALRERYTVIESDIIPSIGSLLHNQGYCKPCVFANKKTNHCKSGFHCNFCHYNHKSIKSKNTKLQLTSIPSAEYMNHLRPIKRDDSSVYSYSSRPGTFSRSSSSSSLTNLLEIHTTNGDEIYRYYDN